MKKSLAAFAILAGLLTLAGGAAMRAAGGPDFSGEWKMNPSKSNLGAMPAPDLLVRTIKQHDPALEISTHTKGSKGEATTELKYTTDGKICVNQLPGGQAQGTAKREGTNLVIESTYKVQASEIQGREVWTLSAGGKVLTIQNHVVTPQGQYDVKYVFDKQ